MPNWGEHLLIANKILKKVKINENLFLFGNILPDVQDGFLIKDISNIQPHKINHYDINGENYDPNNKKEYEIFYEIYSKKMDNPVIMGYLAHLITDSLWNDIFYNGKCIKENDKLIGFKKRNGELIKGDKADLRKNKQIDFGIFSSYIYKKHNMKLPEFSLDISQNANIIENININDDDVKKVVDYINETKMDAINKNQEMQIFTVDELEKEIDRTAEFVCSYLKMKNIIWFINGY